MDLKFTNINDAFFKIVSGLYNGEILTTTTSSRVGEVCVIEEPVIIAYGKPEEKVLFNTARDANPFFHLFESLWMLSGRNDLAPLQYYVSNFDNYSDDGVTLNGAYGFRWRNHEFLVSYIDQLEKIISHLRKTPNSRRAVLQMWNVEDDLLKIEESKDVCCNLSVLFSIENGDCSDCDENGLIDTTTEKNKVFRTKESCQRCKGERHEVPLYLNMTVFNRSNDLIWGTMGANAVHFAFLQEYVAGRLNLKLGTYYQVSNNQHFYTEKWEPEKWLEWYKSGENSAYYYPEINSRYSLLNSAHTLDIQLEQFIEDKEASKTFGNLFLEYVAKPVKQAFNLHKEREYGKALERCEDIALRDWRIACQNWLTKRRINWEKKQK